MRTHLRRDTAAASVRILLFWFASVREGVRARVCRLHAAWTPADGLDWTTYSITLGAHHQWSTDDMMARITGSRHFITSLPSQALRRWLSNQRFHLRKQTRRKHFRNHQPGGSPLCATPPPLLQRKRIGERGICRAVLSFVFLTSSSHFLSSRPSSLGNSNSSAILRVSDDLSSLPAFAACRRTSRVRRTRPMYGASGNSEPSVVNHSDHSAGSELPLRGRGREHRSPSSAFARDFVGANFASPDSSIQLTRLDSSSCHWDRTRVRGPSVLGGPLACGDRFAKRREVAEPSADHLSAPHRRRLDHFQGLRSVSRSPLTLPSAGQPNRRCGRAYPYSIGTPSSPSESRAAVVSDGPAYAHCRGSTHQTKILLKRGMARHARARAQSHTRACPLAPPAGQHTGFSPSHSLRERPWLAWHLSIP